MLKKVPSVFAVAESGTGKREPDQTGGEEEEVIDVESEQLDSSVDILETSFSQEHKVSLKIDLENPVILLCCYI